MERTNISRQQGVSLIELVCTISIIAVVNGLAGSMLGETVKRNQLENQAERVLTTLNLARSEAVKRNLPVSVCSSSDGETCSGSWTDGWIVFSNADADQDVDNGVDDVIRVYEGLADGHTLSGTVGSDAMTYYADGSYARSQDSIEICSHDADLDFSWTLAINTVGRPRAMKGASSCS